MPVIYVLLTEKKLELKIESLKLKNFRNYEYLDLDLDSETNIFYGDNAQGKTNILEAVYLSGTTKSHRGAKDKDMIRFGQDEAHVRTVVEKKEIQYQIDVHLKRNHPKGIAINKMPIRKASELFGLLNLVFFSPEDLNIIKNGPAQRRRFIDLELSQLDKVYLSDLSNYNRAVNQRNSLLKESSPGKEINDTLDLWEEQIIRYGNQVMERREEFINEINEIIADIHKRLTKEENRFQLVYEPGSGDLPLEMAIKKNRERDLRVKSTTVGPHRDDIGFRLGDLDLRRYGSQGQQRSAALALKLSEIEIVRRKTGETPVLLLDDVLSELDKHRQNALLDNINDIQTLITCTGVDEFVNHRFSVNKVFHVQNGQAVKEN